MNTSLRTIHGTTRLAFDSVEGMTNAVERMHETIARRPLPWTAQPTSPTRAHGLIAAAVYATVRGVNNMLRAGTDQSFALLPDIIHGTPHSSAEIRMIAALNGAFGDHLEATDNPLATPMTLMTPQQPLELEATALAAAIPSASAHLVVLVHGLSLSELSWNRKGAPCIGSKLQQEIDCTPLYLRYNTGRHISTNGQEFAQLLQQLIAVYLLVSSPLYSRSDFHVNK